MTMLSSDEAQLFRVLSSIFGRDRVIPHMRAVAICGGSISEAVEAAQPGVRSWAERNTCLFTLIDSADEPQLVIEFFSGFQQYVDAREEQHQRFLPELLRTVGVKYITLSPEEFAAILECGDIREFYRTIGEKLGMGDIYDEPEQLPATAREELPEQ